MSETRDRIENLVMRIQTDYLEHPILALKLPAAQTRFGVDFFHESLDDEPPEDRNAGRRL